jgi:hypothetical protein
MKNSVILVSLIFLMSFKCTKDFKDISVANKSDKTIFAVISPNDKIGTDEKYSEVYKKSYVGNVEDSLSSYPFIPIYPNTRNGEYDDWKAYSNRIIDKKIRIFIVPKDSVAKHGWLNIFYKNIYVKKYEYTIDELELMNFEIVYE